MHSGHLGKELPNPNDVQELHKTSSHSSWDRLRLFENLSARIASSRFGYCGDIENWKRNL